MHLISVYHLFIYSSIVYKCSLSYDGHAIWLYNPVLSAGKAILLANHTISYL